MEVPPQPRSKPRGKRARDAEPRSLVPAKGRAAAAKTKAKPAAAAGKKASAKADKKPAAVVPAARRPKLIWRTRDQENSMLYNLQLDVASLQSELRGLSAYRTLLMSRAVNRCDDPDGSFVKTVREYFRVFKHGYMGEHHASLVLPRRTADERGVASPDEFVRRVVDENVCIGRFAGLAQMMKQWQRYSSVLGPLTLSFLDSALISTYRGAGEGVGQVFVTSRAQYHLYISLRTIENMFPHLLPHHEIVTKILGRRISGVGKFDFVFNAENNRIVRYEFSLDFMASFIDLLGDPATVALLLKDALISDEFFIGDLSEFVPGQDDAPKMEALVLTDRDGPAPVRAAASPRCPWKMSISSLLSTEEDQDMEPDAEPRFFHL